MELPRVLGILALLVHFAWGNEKGLGLITDGSTIVISNKNELLKAGILALGNFSIDAAITELTKIKTAFRSLENIAGIKSSNDIKKKFAPIFLTVNEHFEFIRELLVELSKFSDPSKPDTILMNRCHVNLAPFENIRLTELLDQVNLLIENLNIGSIDATKILEKETQLRVLSTIYMINDLVEDLKRATLERKTVLSLLMENQVPDELETYLTSQNCLAAGKAEEIVIDFCRKEKLGIFCEITIHLHNELMELTKIVPISYHGVELMAENKDQLIVRSADGKIGFLKCDLNLDEADPTKSLSYVKEGCSFELLNQDCATSLNQILQAQILKYCNFTRKEPILGQWVKDGLLIQGEKQELEITEYDLNGQNKRPIASEAPLLIASNKVIEIKKGKNTLKFPPRHNVVMRRILHTYLSEEFQNQLVTQAMWHDLKQGLDWEDLIDVILIGIVGILVPVTSCLCYFKIKASDLIENCRRQRAKMRTKVKPKKRLFEEASENLKENQKFLRNPDLQIFKLEKAAN